MGESSELYLICFTAAGKIIHAIQEYAHIFILFIFSNTTCMETNIPLVAVSCDTNTA